MYEIKLKFFIERLDYNLFSNKLTVNTIAMFKIATLAAIGAVASATFLESERNLDNTFGNAAGFNAACTYSTTAETCS